MARINCKLACCSAFIFSLAIALSGCVPEEKPEGYKLYSAKCSVCHRLLPPEDYPIEKFEQYVEKYGKGMTAEEKTRLLSHLKDYKERKAKQP